MFRKSLLQNTLSFLLIHSYINTANQNVLKVERGVYNLLIGITKLKLKSKQSQVNCDIGGIVVVAFFDTKNLIGKPDYTFCIEKNSFKVILLKGLTYSEEDEAITEIKTGKVELLGSYRNSEDWNSIDLTVMMYETGHIDRPFFKKEETLKLDEELALDSSLIKETTTTQEKMSLETTDCANVQFVQFDDGGIPFINIGSDKSCGLWFDFSLAGNPLEFFMKPVYDSVLQKVLEALIGNPSVTGDSGENTGEPKEGNSVEGKNGSFILNPIFYIPLLLGLVILVGLSFYFYSHKKRKYIVAMKKKI